MLRGGAEGLRGTGAEGGDGGCGAAMRVCTSAPELGGAAGGVLVPTMGALHEGHLSLVDAARAHAARRGVLVVVSLFVNPTQFDDAGDLESYPRDIDGDVAKCAARGVDAVYVPEVGEVYPGGPAASEARVPAVGREPGLEDRWRPGHFAGVCAVVPRLFELTGCVAAVFGEKDWQQLRVVRAVVRGERLGVEVIGGRTVREADGLAMSSRNVRLGARGRKMAGELASAMRDAEGSGRAGDEIESDVASRIERAGMEVEYVAVRDAETLVSVRANRPRRLLVAARCGDVRLVDNVAV